MKKTSKIKKISSLENYQIIWVLKLKKKTKNGMEKTIFSLFTYSVCDKKVQIE